jgi:hypothetical protein
VNLFSINGTRVQAPMGLETRFEDLMTYLHKTLVSDTSLITSIRVNGTEIGPTEEADLAGKPLSALESIEVVCVHPREIAEETLQTLRLLLPTLAQMSRKASSDADVRKLVDGLETLADAVSSTRAILRIGKLDRVDALEMDLLSILKDLLEAQKQGDGAYRAELLLHHLPSNLEAWAASGIPDMIRARDS